MWGERRWFGYDFDRLSVCNNSTIVVDQQDGLRNICNTRGKLKIGEIKKHMERIKVWPIYCNLQNYLRQNEVVVGIGPAAIINISISTILK